MYDNPILFYVNQTMIRRIGEPGNWMLLPVYLYDRSETEALKIKIKCEADKITAGGKAFYGNEIMTEKYLHDCVAKSVEYDYEAPKNKECFDAHSIVGALLEKRAVCEGIAKTFKFLCEKAGIKCIVVYGMAKGSYHSWNMVILRQEFYHVDVTWDSCSYDYFNLTTEEIMRDHLLIGSYPLCTSTRFHNL
jgi:transglutaminase/protease-like cytokinesis protein 3